MQPAEKIPSPVLVEESKQEKPVEEQSQAFAFSGFDEQPPEAEENEIPADDGF